ncbi:MAG: hypothetical protein H7Y31_02795 [Chitinophagaceae bacterium]|nr:hypothetical protein [Chitinophagaceae bacterium]
MATQLQHTPKKPGLFLLFPWSLAAIVLILLLTAFLHDWIGSNWNWVAFLLIIPAAIFENIKIGYTSIKVMFLKIFYSLLSFMVVGFTAGLSISTWYYHQNAPAIKPMIDLPWYIWLAIIIVLLIELAHIFSLLKALKRELVQFE